MNTEFSMVVTSQGGEEGNGGHGLLLKMKIHITLHYKYKHTHIALSTTSRNNQAIHIHETDYKWEKVRFCLYFKLFKTC